MTWFNVLIETNTDELTDDQFDRVIDSLIEFSPSVGLNPIGQLSIRISIQATSIRQATELSIAFVGDVLNRADINGKMVAINTLTEEEFLRRENIPDEADVVGTAEAAEIMGVSTQRVVQLATRLNAVKIGKTYAFPRRTVENAAKKQGGNSGTSGLSCDT